MLRAGVMDIRPREGDIMSCDIVPSGKYHPRYQFECDLVRDKKRIDIPRLDGIMVHGTSDALLDSYKASTLPKIPYATFQIDRNLVCEYTKKNNSLMCYPP